MRELDLSNVSQLAGRLDSLRELSRARTASDVFSAFIGNANKMRRFARIMGVRPEPEEPGAYRVTFLADMHQVRAGAAIPKRASTADEIAALPVRRGGFIGAMTSTRRDEPRVYLDLDLRGDPVFGDVLSDVRSVVIIPAFEDGHVTELSFSFFDAPETPDASAVDGALTMVNMLATADRTLSSLATVQQLHEAMIGQLEEVARLQQALLPSRLPEIPGLELASSYLTSERAGGDYYDFLPLDDGRWAIMIADASGHGPAAATFMAMVRGILHAIRADWKGPGEVMAALNQHLAATPMQGAFATAFLLLYNPRTGLAQDSSAGHPPPIMKLGSNGSVRLIDDAGSLPLGILPEAEYPESTLSLCGLDSLVLYTDGITEAFSPQGEMFGTERLSSVLTTCTGAPDCTVESIHRAVYEHTRSRRRMDDQTIVSMRFHGVTRSEGEVMRCNFRPHVTIPV